MPFSGRGLASPQGRAWGEPPQALAHNARALAEQLLEYAEMFSNEGDPSAACAQARFALDGLEALAEARRPFVDEALGSLLERARLELGLYEAQWAKWQQENDERQSTFAVHEQLALKRVEGLSEGGSPPEPIKLVHLPRLARSLSPTVVGNRRSLRAAASAKGCAGWA